MRNSETETKRQAAARLARMRRHKRERKAAKAAAYAAYRAKGELAERQGELAIEPCLSVAFGVTPRHRGQCK